MTVIEGIDEWLERRFPLFRRFEQHEGTYGVVLVLQARHGNVSPQRFALKTFMPKPGGGLSHQRGLDIPSLFRREVSLWLHVQPHPNVLPALGIEIRHALDVSGERIPLVRMPYCEGSLHDWTRRDSDVGRADRLLAIAEACNGLVWLYAHGIEGHGDLKPGNLLLRNLTTEFAGIGDWTQGLPSASHPWNVRVADLGWTDIWRELGYESFTDRAWRPYLAPERFAGSFVPMASDLYAMGIITSELLSRLHPAGDRTEALASKWGSRKWRQWTARGSRNLSLIDPPELRDMLQSCLDPDPNARPTAEELRDEVCSVIENDFDLPATSYLDDLNQVAWQSESALHAPWAAREARRLGDETLSQQIGRLQSSTPSDAPSKQADMAQWLANSLVLAGLLLRRAQSGDIQTAEQLARRVLSFVIANPNLDLRRFFWTDPGTGELAVSDLTPNEVMGDLVFEAYRELLTIGAGDADKLYEQARRQLRI